jgi:ectoine hydroxylase-related dioxygenase (phytanoyl-CoA dioxygenase family)
MALERLTLDKDGAALFAGAALSVLGEVEAIVADLPPDRAGVRLHGGPGLEPLLAKDSVIGAISAAALGAACVPVRAILFDKSPATNWTLGWHQDRTIAVRERREVENFGPWTVKQGMLHVEPPFAIIEAMMTLRIHIDDVPADNAPLLIAPGSHRLGRIEESRIDAVNARHGTRTCLARRGDVWAYATPILHASAAAHTSSDTPTRRRVLQVDYAAGALPGGLVWRGL